MTCNLKLSVTCTSYEYFKHLWLWDTAQSLSQNFRVVWVGRHFWSPPLLSRATQIPFLQLCHLSASCSKRKQKRYIIPKFRAAVKKDYEQGSCLMSRAYLIIKFFVSRLEEDIYNLQTTCSDSFYRPCFLRSNGSVWLNLLCMSQQ